MGSLPGRNITFCMTTGVHEFILWSLHLIAVDGLYSYEIPTPISNLFIYFFSFPIFCGNGFCNLMMHLTVKLEKLLMLVLELQNRNTMIYFCTVIMWEKVSKYLLIHFFRAVLQDATLKFNIVLLNHSVLKHCLLIA